MTERPTLGVGLMSGTSLDGVDAALVRFQGPAKATLVAFRSHPYTLEQRGLLERALEQDTPRGMAHIHVRIAEWAAEGVHALLQEAHVRATDVDFIAFPGQTVWHEPPLVSWQLGEPAVLAERFGVRVVSGFRARDVAAGGQGAPLVPMADVLLFGAIDHPRLLLNLGGIANLSYVPRREVEEGVLAFDTGPGVVLIDEVARLVDPSLPFDTNGNLARAGTVHEDVVAELLEDAYFNQPPPRSTGREHFGRSYAHRLYQRAPGPDGVATAVELTVRSVTEAIVRWAPRGCELVASGGGVRHPILWQRLSEAAIASTAAESVALFDDLFFNGDAKEAVGFALLGYLTIHGQPGNVPSATGARGPRVLGMITPA